MSLDEQITLFYNKEQTENKRSESKEKNLQNGQTLLCNLFRSCLNIPFPRNKINYEIILPIVAY